MSDDLSFSLHHQTQVEIAQKLSGWVLRVFKLWMNFQCLLSLDLLFFLALNTSVSLLPPPKLAKSVTLKVSKDHSLQKLKVLKTLIIGIALKASNCIHLRGGERDTVFHILGKSWYLLFQAFLPIPQK